MNNRLSLLVLISIFGISVLLFLSGCYTQVGTTRDTDEEEQYVSESVSDDSVVSEENEKVEYTDNGCYEDVYRPRVGFSYYYPSTYWPSTAFAVAYSDPWFYDYNWWAYDRWHYTSPYSWYYSSWYPYYYPSNYYWNYNYGGSYVYGSRRTDGKMVGSDNNRRLRDNSYEIGGTTRTNFDLPAAGSLKRTPAAVSGANRNTTNNRTATRRDATGAVNSRRENRASERSFDRPSREVRSGRVDDRRRDTRAQQRPVETYKPPVHNTPPREDRAPSPSYTPPPAPRNNPPPPSNDGGRRNDGGGGSRSSSGGGGSRDRRP